MWLEEDETECDCVSVSSGQFFELAKCLLSLSPLAPKWRLVRRIARLVPADSNWIQHSERFFPKI